MRLKNYRRFLKMVMTYDDFKDAIARLRFFEEKVENPCDKADYRAEILWLKEEYVEYWERLKLEERGD
jgi:hypothetical protein